MPVVLDLILLGVLLVFALRGIKIGFVKQIIDFAGLILAIVLPALYGPEIATSLARRFDWDVRLLAVLLYAASFFVILVGVSFFGSVLKKGVQLTVLGWVDRAAGGLLGLLKVALAMSVALLILLQIPWGTTVTRQLRRSYVIPAVVPLAPVAFDTLMALLGQSRRFRSVADWERWSDRVDRRDEFL